MSMTTTAFIKKEKVPNRLLLETEIKKLGYDFKFLEDFDKLDDFGGTCQLEGFNAFVELNGEDKEDILQEYEITNDNLSDYDYCISFYQGSHDISGACVGILLLVLIDICNSKVIYQDEQVWYTREMLIQDISQYINEGKKNPKDFNFYTELPKADKKKKNNLAEWILWGLAFFTTILMGREVINWVIPGILLILVVINSVLEHNDKGNIFSLFKKKNNQNSL